MLRDMGITWPLVSNAQQLTERVTADHVADGVTDGVTDGDDEKQPDAAVNAPPGVGDPSPDRETEIVVAEPPPPTGVGKVDPIRFDYLVGGVLGHAHLLMGASFDKGTHQVLKDISRFLDWQAGHGSDTAKLRGSGTFEWPQLLSTAGDPSRALGAFIAKQLTGAGVIVADATVASVLKQWWDADKDVRLLVVPEMSVVLDDPQMKKTLWQALSAPA